MCQAVGSETTDSDPRNPESNHTMKNSINSSILLSILCASTPLQAAVIMDDFTTGGTGSWYKGRYLGNTQ